MTKPMLQAQGGVSPVQFTLRLRAAGRALLSRDFQGVAPNSMIPPRGISKRGGAIVTETTSLRHSAVWACLRLRADLVSTMPIDCYRSGTGELKGIDIEVPRPPVLVNPGGDEWDYVDWMTASQHSFDGSGNVIGLISEYDGNNLPSRIDLQNMSSVTVIQRKGQRFPIYKIDGTEYSNDPSKKRKEVWHERQFPVPGLAVGMSPLMFAAWSVGEFLSIQDFVLDWFGGGAVPKAKMRNKARSLKDTDITKAKQWYRDVMTNGDLIVFGNDWEYDMIQSETSGFGWLEMRGATVPDIARFMGCPADLIDAAVSGQAITYANISQRNLQFLIMNLGPTVIRREKNLSKLLLQPRFVKLNTDALLRLDPETRALVIGKRIDQRTLTVTEARALDNLPPLTAAQEAEFARLFPIKVATTPPEKVASQQRALSRWAEDVDAPVSAVPGQIEVPEWL